MVPKMTSVVESRILQVLIPTFFSQTVLAGFAVTANLFLFEALKTKDITAGVNNVKAKFEIAYFASIKFWLPYALVIYSAIPIHWRVLSVNLGQIGWHVYLSFLSNNPTEKGKEISVLNIIPHSSSFSIKDELIFELA
mmetsp:Transcript_40434/g.35890  ORF Transcript_40434/g.35890 Transcript_40434/m.35890 type:complete len:138 (-) Transcript_40434:415-828(-)